MLKALSAMPDWRDGHECRAGAEALLQLWETSQDQHPYQFYMGTDFCKLKAPLVWYDLLHAKHVIDGGPLGFLTWSIPTLVGSLAYDVVSHRSANNAIRPLVVWGCVLSALGYALSCLNAVFSTVQPGGLAHWLGEPPFWPPSRPVDLWTMSQRAGSNSYLWFSAGLSLLVYALFVWWTDVKGRQSGLLRVFGLNPLAGYIIHDLIGDAVRPFAPADSPLYWVALTFLIYFGIIWFFLWGLDRQKIYLRM